MLARLKKIFRAINAFLNEYYDHSGGCCAAGGLSVAELEGRRPPKTPDK